MNKNAFSPYVRVAMLSTLVSPFKVSRRVIFDYEIILVTGGKCKITIDKREYLCKKNDVVFLRPGVEHEFECVDKADFVQPHIHFDISYDDMSEKRFVSFKPVEAMSEGERAMIQEDEFQAACIPYVFAPSDADGFKKNFFEIIRLFEKKEYNYELLCKSKMLELLNRILMQFNNNRAIRAEVIHDPVSEVKHYIDNNYLSVITLDSLSKQFYFNKYTLIRKFKAKYGCNIISYYRNKRIQYIKRALKTTELTVTALAEKLNFADIYSFSRFFKTYEGCSPSDYRKGKAKG